MTASKQTLPVAVCDIAIVGAGPAGLAAALTLNKLGAGVTILDELPVTGGQVGHLQPGDFLDGTSSARQSARVEAVFREVSARADIEWRLQSSVFGSSRPSGYRVSDRGPSHELWIQGPQGISLLHANAVLMAPGSHERPFAFPGWTLPGVMGAGAIQTFVRGQRLPGERFALVGSHPFQLRVADELLNAGAPLAAVVFTQRRRRALATIADPLVALRHPRALRDLTQMFRRIERANVPVIFGHAPIRTDGAGRVESVTIASLRLDGSPDRNRTRQIECDCLGIAHGWMASSELVRQAGAKVHWNEYAGGWLAAHDEWLQSSVQGLFVAGDVTGVEGADAACEKGRIAALGMLRSLGRLDAAAACEKAAPSRRRLKRIRQFTSLVELFARPPAQLALETMSDDTMLCRCQSISCGELRRALIDHAYVTSADAAKSLCGVGMGRCQGRMCGEDAARIVASVRGSSVEEVGPFQARAPIKPVLLATLMRGR